MIAPQPGPVAGDSPASIAAQLREAFDRGFAEPPAPGQAAFDDLLAVQVGDRPHALRLPEIAGLHIDHPVTPIPSADPQFMGLAAFRNLMAPVFDLRLVLGYAGGAPPRWLALVRAATPVALAFDAFDGHLRLPQGQISEAPPDSAAAPFLRGAVQAGALIRPVIHLASVVEALARRIRPTAGSKER